jgi:hypothetical protein
MSQQTMIYYIGLWIILPFYSVYDLLIGHTLRAAGTIKAIITGILGFMIGSMIGPIVGIIIGAAIFIIPIPIVHLILAIPGFSIELVRYSGVSGCTRICGAHVYHNGA